MSVFCLIDRSGSMASCADDTIGGFNTFIKNQPSNTMISLSLFDHEIKHVYTKVANDVEPLDHTTFVPRGSTALLDAIGKVIKSVPHGTVKPIIMILTDGLENSSRVYTKMHINDLITEKRLYEWEFIFLAANQDAIQAAGEIGIPEMSALSFNTDNVKNAFRSVSAAVGRKRTGDTQTVQFSQDERMESTGSCV